MSGVEPQVFCVAVPVVSNVSVVSIVATVIMLLLFMLRWRYGKRLTRGETRTRQALLADAASKQALIRVYLRRKQNAREITTRFHNLSGLRTGTSPPYPVRLALPTLDRWWNPDITNNERGKRSTSQQTGKMCSISIFIFTHAGELSISELSRQMPGCQRPSKRRPGKKIVAAMMNSDNQDR
jgi:hypothetical protein